MYLSKQAMNKDWPKSSLEYQTLIKYMCVLKQLTWPVVHKVYDLNSMTMNYLMASYLSNSHSR